MSTIFNIPQEQAKLSGIYLIRNKTNDKIYVGSSINFHERFCVHMSRLRSGKHINKHLQASFNKNGEDSFVFSLLEIVHNREELLKREQHYIDTLQPHYNIAKQAGRPADIEWTSELRLKHGETMRKRVLSKESKQRVLDALDKGRSGYHQRTEEDRAKHRKNISDALKGRTLSEEHRKKCAVANLGNKHTDETKQAIREANSNSYIVISPTLERYEINDGLLGFAKQNNLDESSLAKCARGVVKHHKAWQCFYAADFTEDKIQDPSSFKVRGDIIYTITKPDGTQETTNNLYEYARQNNLDGSCLCKVLKGKLPHHKKYKVQ